MEENTTVQQLVAEALVLLFESRNKPTIARPTAGLAVLTSSVTLA